MRDNSSSDQDSAQYQRIYRKLLEKEKKAKRHDPEQTRPSTNDRKRGERQRQQQNEKFQQRAERSRSRQKKMQIKWSIYKMQEKFSFQYNRFPQQIRHLPIFKKKQQIIKNILQNQIVLITGQTGCGKSTQVPRLLYQYLIQHKSKAKILCVQPRRLAVLNLYHILDHQMIQRQQIGYQIAMQSRISSKAKILFMTNGIFLQRLVHSSEMFQQFPFIILDEVHERDIDTDFILLAIKRIIRNYPKLRVILMSATIDNDLFRFYFANDHIDKFMKQQNFYIRIMQSMDKRNNIEDKNENQVYEKFSIDFMKSKYPCPTVNVTQTGKFKRQIFYLDTLQHFLKRQYPKLWGGIIFSQKYPSTHRQLFRIVHYIIEEVIQRGTSDRSYSSVLIFLPGLLQIQTLNEQIRRQFKDNPFNKYIQTILVHSSILNEQITKKLHQLNKEKVKIILATNIAESSITVMGVKYVIDFCLSKQVRFDQRSRMENLQLIWASQASCKQRAGRTGRVCDGVIIRLVESSFFQKLPEYSTPQIQRSSLDRLVLRIKMIHQNEKSQIFSDPGTVLGTAIQPPVLKNIDQAINSLLFCGGLKHLDDNLVLTNLGRLYVDLPIDITYSKMLIMSILFGTFDDIIILVSILSQNKNPFKKQNIEKDYLKYFQMMDNVQRCDFRSLINAYKNTKRQNQHKSQLQIGKKFYKPYEYIRDQKHENINPIHFDVFNETDILIEDLGQRLAKKQILTGYTSAQGQSDYDQRFKFTLIGGLLGKMMVARQAIYDQKQQKRAKIMRSMGVNFKNTIALINSPNVRKSCSDSITAQQKTKDFWKEVIAKNIGSDPKQIKLTITSGVSYLHFNNQRDLNKLLFIKYMEDNKKYSSDDRSQCDRMIGNSLNIQGMLKGLGDIDYMQNGTTFTLLKDQRVTIDHFSQNRQIEVSPGQKRRYLLTNTIMQQSSRLFCRYTSLIPDIPNIQVISHLVFHPFLSLIRDKKCERYQYISLKKRNKLKIQYQLTQAEIKEANKLRKLLEKFFELEFLKKKQNDESFQEGVTFINEFVRNNYNKQPTMQIQRQPAPFLSQFWPYLKKFVFRPRLSLVDETKWQEAFFKQEQIKLPQKLESIKLQDENDHQIPQFMNGIKSTQLRESYFSSQYVSNDQYIKRLTTYNNWKRKKLYELMETKQQAQNKNAYISCQHCSINIAPLKSVGSVSNSYYRQLYSVVQQNIIQLPFNEMGTHFCSLLMSLYIQKEFKIFGCPNQHYFAIKFEGQRNYKITKFSELKIIFPDGSQQIADFDRLQYGRWRQKNDQAIKKKEAMKIHKDCFVCDETFTNYKQIQEHFKEPYHLENIKDFKTSLPVSEDNNANDDGY